MPEDASLPPLPAADAICRRIIQPLLISRDRSLPSKVQQTALSQVNGRRVQPACILPFLFAIGDRHTAGHLS